jgi:hypothetical protein
MGGGGGDAQKSNDLLQKQIDEQNLERTQKLHSLYSDELVSLKSQGVPTYQTPADVKPVKV